MTTTQPPMSESELLQYHIMCVQIDCEDGHIDTFQRKKQMLDLINQYTDKIRTLAREQAIDDAIYCFPMTFGMDMLNYKNEVIQRIRALKIQKHDGASE